MRKQKKSTRMFLNLKTIQDDMLVGFHKQALVYYQIAPYNLSVLSKENIEAKVFSLMNVVKGVDSLEIICINSRENFKNNKLFIKQRIDQETNIAIIKLLEQDLKKIDELQSTTATARLFLVCIRLSEFNTVENTSLLMRVEKVLKAHGFSVKKLSKADLKTMLAVYYEQNVTSERFDDINGERWLKDES